jgi:hypothetical protein
MFRNLTSTSAEMWHKISTGDGLNAKRGRNVESIIHPSPLTDVRCILETYAATITQIQHMLYGVMRRRGVNFRVGS